MRHSGRCRVKSFQFRMSTALLFKFNLTLLQYVRQQCRASLIWRIIITIITIIIIAIIITIIITTITITIGLLSPDSPCVVPTARPAALTHFSKSGHVWVYSPP